VERWRGLLRLDRSVAADSARRAAAEEGNRVHFTCDMPNAEDEGTLQA
jgi:hypothetical protein